MNPFITSGYAGSEYFCNREKETNLLLENIENNLSTSIIALRRIGKTGLVKHVISKLPKETIPVYIDIFPTENLKDFTEKLATAIIREMPAGHKFGKAVIKFIQSLRPTLSFDPLSGLPQVELKNQQENSKENIQSIFSFLQNLDRKVVIIIDEFQQITNYPEKNTDAFLRSIMQQLNNVVFIFTGSHQHLMKNLFTNPSKPFYRSTQLISIKKIDRSDYREFIALKFTNGKKQIADEIINQILDWTEDYTYYVQLLCNKVYSSSNKVVNEQTWKYQALELLKEQQIIFLGYRDLLTSHQWGLLKAIAKEGNVSSPTSKDFIGKHSLGSPATVLRSLKALQDKELIYATIDLSGAKQYFVYDVFLKQWLNTI
jgi:AAA+ ATPase superfamily predicted ATPase